jgi:hypothetical protein
VSSAQNIAEAPPEASAPPGEEKIRELAYFIWDRSGRPEGCERAHWEEAERQIAMESGLGFAYGESTLDTRFSR